jgi:hypothetical protein
MDVPQATMSAEVAAASASVDVTLYTTPEARFRAGVEALFSVWSGVFFSCFLVPMATD